MDNAKAPLGIPDGGKMLDICARVRALTGGGTYYVDTYGCQQNESDSEIIRGWLEAMGYRRVYGEFDADIVVVNTCAVREHAEMRILGNVGALIHSKRSRPGQIVAVCGCMAQQGHMAEKLKRSYPVVDIVFGTHMLDRFPELLLRRLETGKRVFETPDGPYTVAEGLPRSRDGGVRAWLSVMYGCDNFCSYCVVPYVRGRERSRRSAGILAEARALVESGVKEITLLGQNVNSYGKTLGEGEPDFAGLLRMVNDIEGDFVIRFMTSHPKDATPRLFEAMAQCEKCETHLHLPVQCGSDRVLAAMNRGYTAQEYLDKLALARSLIPNLVVTTDIIVGFPGETHEEFLMTMELARRARFDSMFTFIYSPRAGTAAAAMPDPRTREEKQADFDALLNLANEISLEKHGECIGKTERVLIDGFREDGEYNLSSRTKGGRLVHLKGAPEDVGRFAEAEITGRSTYALYGRLKGDPQNG